MDLLAIILTVIGIIVSVFIAIYTLKKQGSYKKAKLDFYPLSFTNLLTNLTTPETKDYVLNEINSSPIVNIYLGMFPSGNKHKVVLSQPITIKNSGELTAENISVKIFYHQRYSAENFVDPFSYEQLAKLDYGIKRVHFTTFEKMCCSIFEITMIPKGETIEFFEFFLYESSFLEDDISPFEVSILSSKDKSLAAFPIYYEVSGKNIESTIKGSFYYFFSIIEDINEFLKEHDSMIIKLAKSYHPNYKRAYNQKYWLAWPYKFWFVLLYKKRMVKFIVAFKNIETVHKIELDSDIVYEYFPDTVYSYTISDYSPFSNLPKSIKKIQVGNSE